MNTFTKILAAQTVKSANWKSESDGFEALYIELMQEAFNNVEGQSYHGAKLYARKYYVCALKNKMLNVEF